MVEALTPALRDDLNHIVVHVWLCKSCWEIVGKPDFLTQGVANCQGCGRKAKWVPVRWVTIKLPKVVASG